MIYCMSADSCFYQWNPSQFIINGRPARSALAQPCRYCFYSLVQKSVFRPAGATRCPDTRKTWHGSRPAVRFPVANFTFIEAEMWECSPQNCQNFEFWPCTPQGRLVCTIFTKLSAFVRVYYYRRVRYYRFAFKFFVCFMGRNNEVISIFPRWGHFPTNFQ